MVGARELREGELLGGGLTRKVQGERHRGVLAEELAGVLVEESHGGLEVGEGREQQPLDDAATRNCVEGVGEVVLESGPARVLLQVQGDGLGGDLGAAARAQYMPRRRSRNDYSRTLITLCLALSGS